MVLYNTPLLMVLTFLGLNLLIGLYSTKKTTFREYAVGNKRLQTTTLVVTVLATVFGGAPLMRAMPLVYDKGMPFIILYFFASGIHYIVPLLALRMGPFMEHFSIAETIGSVYGKYPRAIAAVLGICFLIDIVSFQISAISYVMHLCMESIDDRIVVILATLILIAYAMLGGVRAITITDILQFVTFIVIMLLLIKFLFVQTGKPFLEIVLLLKKEEKFQVSNALKFDTNLFNLVFKYLYYAFCLNPAVMQRAYMSSSPIQAYKVFLRVILFSVIILGCIILMGLLVFVVDPTLQATEIWSSILSHMPSAYKVYVIICVLGMAMSTADSSLHTIAIMMSHDLVACVRGVKAGSYMYQLRLAKLTTFVTGLLAMTLSIYHPDLSTLTRYAMEYITSLFHVIIIPPFILAVLGFRGSSRTFLIGMCIGALSNVYLDKWIAPRIGIDLRFLSLVANGLAMIAAHYLLPQPPGKGWTGRNDQHKRIQQLIRAFKKYKKSVDIE